MLKTQMVLSFIYLNLHAWLIQFFSTKYRLVKHVYMSFKFKKVFSQSSSPSLNPSFN